MFFATFTKKMEKRAPNFNLGRAFGGKFLGELGFRPRRKVSHWILSQGFLGGQVREVSH